MTLEFFLLRILTQLLLLQLTISPIEIKNIPVPGLRLTNDIKCLSVDLTFVESRYDVNLTRRE